MPRPLKNLTCPFCSTTRVSKPITRQSATTLETEYECGKCLLTFTTVEQLSKAPLDGVLVQPPATMQNSRPKAKPFNGRVLEKHLRLTLRKQLTEAQRQRLADMVTAELAKRVPSLTLVPGTDNNPVIQSSDVRRAVQDVLEHAAERADAHYQEQYESAYILYAMTAVGRTVYELLDIIRNRYPSAATEDDLLPAAPMPAEQWHYSAAVPAPHPISVVKNFRRAGPEQDMDGAALDDRAALRDRRPRETFSSTKLNTTIRRALGSTPLVGTQTMPKDEAVKNIHEWVLWSLAGQPVVRSSQLATVTSSVLRRCAPMAYLKWVTLGKELSVGEIYLEAASLLTMPSRPLEFELAAAPVVHRESAPTFAW